MDRDKTTLDRLPLEILQQIFCYITPQQAYKFIRLCRQIFFAISDPFFCRMNMLNFERFYLRPTTPPRTATPQSPEFRSYQQMDRYAPKRMDILLMTSWPLAFKVAYVDINRIGFFKFNIHGYNLGVTIPSFFGEMEYLTVLQLSQDNLHGEIPAILGTLSHLRELDLSENALTGQIPAELGNLSNLKTLELHVNKLTGSIPPDLARLSSIELITLDMNQLSGEIPRELCISATTLKTLSLSGNEISGEIPEEIGNLVALTELFLGRNKLVGQIPASISILKNLESLRLEENPGITGPAPDDLLNCRNLITLELWGTNVERQIPETWHFKTNERLYSLFSNTFVLKGVGRFNPEL